MVERVLIGGLSAAGFLISLYFTMADRDKLAIVDRYVPRLCRIGPDTCGTLLETREARFFGIPNFHLGMIWYIGLSGSVVQPNLWIEMHLMLFFGSLVAVITGFYLSYILIFRVRIRCLLCFISHGINLMIFLVLLIKP
jgi:uncharacterized membrane protein